MREKRKNGRVFTKLFLWVSVCFLCVFLLFCMGFYRSVEFCMENVHKGGWGGERKSGELVCQNFDSFLLIFLYIIQKSLTNLLKG